MPAGHTLLLLTGGLWGVPDWVTDLISSAPEALRIAWTYRLWLVLALMIVAGMWSVVTRHLSERALAERTGYVQIPSQGFDPARGEVDRFGQLVGRTRRRRLSLTPRQAKTVRVRTTTGRRARLAQAIEGPTVAAGLLRQAGYEQTDLRTAEVVLPAADRGEDDVEENDTGEVSGERTDAPTSSSASSAGSDDPSAHQQSHEGGQLDE